MWADFDLFVEALFQQKPGSKYQWFERSPLQLLSEPDLDEHLPKDCLIRAQAAYFFEESLNIPYRSYRFDRALIDQVKKQKNGSLQVSFLLVHEWLWDYFDQNQFLELAQFNRLLHSKAFLGMNQAQFSQIKPLARSRSFISQRALNPPYPRKWRSRPQKIAKISRG